MRRVSPSGGSQRTWAFIAANRARLTLSGEKVDVNTEQIFTHHSPVHALHQRARALTPQHLRDIRRRPPVASVARTEHSVVESFFTPVFDTPPTPRRADKPSQRCQRTCLFILQFVHELDCARMPSSCGSANAGGSWRSYGTAAKKNSKRVTRREARRVKQGRGWMRETSVWGD